MVQSWRMAPEREGKRKTAVHVRTMYIDDTILLKTRISRFWLLSSIISATEAAKQTNCIHHCSFSSPVSSQMATA